MNFSFSVPSILILLIIMGYYFFRPRVPIRLNRSFLALLVIEIGTEAMDILSSWVDINHAQYPEWLLWVLNLLFFLFYFSRIYMFFVFTVSVLDARSAPRSRLHRWTPVVYFLCAAVAVLSVFTGWIFRIDEAGYHSGPLYHLLYFCAGAYLLFSVWAVLRHLDRLSRHDRISLLALQGVLLVGNVIRFLFPKIIVMNVFCMMSTLIIFISFLNPDLYLSERGHVFNLPAFQALLEECYRRRPCRVLAFVIENYNEHREIFGGRQMDEAQEQINRYLVSQFPHMSCFYLHNGYYALVGTNRPDLAGLSAHLRERFTDAWKTKNGELRLNIAFVEADTEVQVVPADRLVNALLISLDELSSSREQAENRSLTDSLAEINQKLDVRRLLECALDEDDLDVYLQPLVRCADGKRVAAEALVRLRDGRGGLILPDLFITLAEREGCIALLGEQVLAKVCRFIRDHDMEALGLQWINVNLSPVQFMRRDIPGRFAEILKEYGVNPGLIHLEITEQSMVDFSLLRDQISGLHRNGFRFALDDYGSGYSNLTRVRQYPFTSIKIDMEVVRNYFRDRDPLIPSLVDAFHRMSLTVVAEGIETPEMAEALKAVGCDFLQGFRFSPAVSMEDFLKLPASW